MKDRKHEVIHLSEMENLDTTRLYRPVCKTHEMYLDKCMELSSAKQIAHQHHLDSGKMCAVGCLTC